MQLLLPKQDAHSLHSLHQRPRLPTHTQVKQPNVRICQSNVYTCPQAHLSLICPCQTHTIFLFTFGFCVADKLT